MALSQRSSSHRVMSRLVGMLARRRLASIIVLPPRRRTVD